MTFLEITLSNRTMMILGAVLMIVIVFVVTKRLNIKMKKQ